MLFNCCNSSCIIQCWLASSLLMFIFGNAKCSCLGSFQREKQCLVWVLVDEFYLGYKYLLAHFFFSISDVVTQFFPHFRSLNVRENFGETGIWGLLVRKICKSMISLISMQIYLIKEQYNAIFHSVACQILF